MSFYPGVTLEDKCYYLRKVVCYLVLFDGLITKESLQAYFNRNLGVDKEYCGICIDLAVLRNIIVYVKETNSYKPANLEESSKRPTLKEEYKAILTLERRYLTLQGLKVYPKISLNRKCYLLRQVVIYLEGFDEPVTKEVIQSCCNLRFGLDKEYCGFVIDLAVYKGIIAYVSKSNTYRPVYFINN